MNISQTWAGKSLQPMFLSFKDAAHIKKTIKAGKAKPKIPIKKLPEIKNEIDLD